MDLNKRAEVCLKSFHDIGFQQDIDEVSCIFRKYRIVIAVDSRVPDRLNFKKYSEEEWENLRFGEFGGTVGFASQQLSDLEQLNLVEDYDLIMKELSGRLPAKE